MVYYYLVCQTFLRSNIVTMTMIWVLQFIFIQNSKMEGKPTHLFFIFFLLMSKIIEFS